MRVKQYQYERDMNKRDRLSYIVEVMLAAILSPSGGVWVGK